MSIFKSMPSLDRGDIEWTLFLAFLAECRGLCKFEPSGENSWKNGDSDWCELGYCDIAEWGWSPRSGPIRDCPLFPCCPTEGNGRYAMLHDSFLISWWGMRNGSLSISEDRERTGVLGLFLGVPLMLDTSLGVGVTVIACSCCMVSLGTPSVDTGILGEVCCIKHWPA